MYVLGQMVEAVKLGGLVLDLQVIRPNPMLKAKKGKVRRISLFTRNRPRFHQQSNSRTAGKANAVALAR